MRKIPREYENPIDDVLLDWCENMAPYFYKHNMTPNHITTISLILGLISVYFLYYDYVKLFMITYLLSYYFDCLDGHVARKYDQVTEFGDKYDHFKDVFVSTLVILVAYIKYKNLVYTHNTQVVGILSVLAVFLILTFVHLGCQQKIYSESGNEIIDNCRMLCPEKNIITWTKYFGSGTWNVIFILAIYYLHTLQAK